MFLNEPNIPIQVIKEDFIAEKGCELWIKREDLTHPDVSGNKWRKLKYNLSEAIETGATSIVTFGGAFSNHIAATAAAGKIYMLPTIGIIRGEATSPLNSTLEKAKSDGMRLVFISRSDYKLRNDPSFVNQIVSQEFKNAFIIPEGGANVLGVKGCEEILVGTDDFNFIVAACGTGGTLAGIINSAKEYQEILGIPVLKDAVFLKEDIAQWLNLKSINKKWQLDFNGHFGGYAKFNNEVVDFINDFKRKHQIQLDPIYTGKAMLNLFRMIKNGEIMNKKILFIHTGGLQGIRGFEERFKISLH